ncbi:chorismate mutase [Aquaspirillum sp. LM1]|nr:chorismate mutase [Aquaspirillum sp. LM1]
MTATPHPLPLCTSLDEVRQHIDRIDCQLVALIAERGGYVAQAAGFKRSADDVAAPQRVAQVLDKVRTLAQQQGASPEVVEAVWRAMIEAFIREEHAQWQAQGSQA